MCKSTELADPQKERERIEARLNAVRERKRGDLLRAKIGLGLCESLPAEKINRKDEIQVAIKSKTKSRPDVALE